jgi:hypothetical protein
MLSRDCDGCGAITFCKKRYKNAKMGDKVYCANGDVHLIDSDSAINDDTP